MSVCGSCEFNDCSECEEYLVSPGGCCCGDLRPPCAHEKVQQIGNDDWRCSDCGVSTL